MKQDKEKQIEDLWQKVIMADENKDYQQVIDLCGKMLELNPKYAEAYSGRGDTYVALKQYQKAIDDYDKAIQTNPNQDATYYNRGNVYCELKQYHKAIDDYSNAIQINPNQDEAYYNRGVVYTNLKQYHKAIDDYDKAIQINPNDNKAYINRGSAYKGLKQYHKAIDDYDKAIQINPNQDEAYYNRGVVYTDLKQYHKAQQDWIRIVYMNSQNALFTTTILNATRGFSLLHRENVPIPPFLRQYVLNQIPPSIYHQFSQILYETAQESEVFNHYIHYLHHQFHYQKITAQEYYTSLVLIYFYMGDAITCYQIIKEHLLLDEDMGIAHTLFTYYYLLLSCEAFLEPYEVYLADALVLAEKHLPPKKGFFAIFQKKEKLSASEIKSIYYAGRIFLFAQQFKQARQCFKRIEKVFLPAAYELLWLYEENHSKKHDNRRDFMDDSKAQKQAILLLQKEKTLQADTTASLCFSKSIPKYQLELNVLKNLNVFQNAAYYLECYPAIDLLFTHYTKEKKARQIYFNKPSDVSDYYKLFQLFHNTKQQIIALPRQLELAQIGETILAKTLRKQNQIALPTKAQTQLVQQLSIQEAKDTRNLFRELQRISDTQIEIFLAQRIYTTEIPAEKLRLLVLYAYTSQQIDVATYFMLQVYIGLCKEKFQTPAHIDAAITAWLKAAFQTMLGASTEFALVRLPIQAIMAGFSASFAHIIYHFSKEELLNSCFPTYAEFKEDFLHHLGEQQEKYGNEFDLKFNIQEFEAWARRDFNA